jgi:hypothetical protein
VSIGIVENFLQVCQALVRHLTERLDQLRTVLLTSLKEMRVSITASASMSDSMRKIYQIPECRPWNPGAN